MQFLAQLSEFFGIAPELAMAAGGVVVLASMIIAVRAWRGSARNTKNLERAIAELEAAHSRRIRNLELQIGRPQTGPRESYRSSTEASSVAAFQPKPELRRDGRETDTRDAHTAPASNIVPLRSTRPHGSGKKASSRFSAEDIRKAISDNRLESWFQPIVGLPGRMPRYYECSPCLRADNGECLAPAQWQTGTSGSETAGEIARATLVECFALARKLRRDKREGSVVWTLGPDDLANEHERERIMALLNANASLRTRLLVSVTIANYDNASDRFEDQMHQIRELGFSFALSGGRNLDQVLKTVAAGQFSLITLPHQTILANSFERAGSVAAKLRAAGARDHIEIAATGIELEETAIELIDCDVMLAQGKLFSDARPLRGKSPSGSGAHSAR